MSGRSWEGRSWDSQRGVRDGSSSLSTAIAIALSGALAVKPLNPLDGADDGGPVVPIWVHYRSLPNVHSEHREIV